MEPSAHLGGPDIRKTSPLRPDELDKPLCLVIFWSNEVCLALEWR